MHKAIYLNGHLTQVDFSHDALIGHKMKKLNKKVSIVVAVVITVTLGIGIFAWNPEKASAPDYLKVTPRTIRAGESFLLSKFESHEEVDPIGPFVSLEDSDEKTIGMLVIRDLNESFDEYPAMFKIKNGELINTPAIAISLEVKRKFTIPEEVRPAYIRFVLIAKDAVT
jgi:hypothetical protein